MSKTDYKSAGVNIDAGNEAVERIRSSVKSTFTSAVMTDVGSFGAMVDLKELLKDYAHPVLVQSIDGVGTKMIVARMMNKYDTIGFDLLAATCNDIIVHGAKPITFLDYIAADKLEPDIIEAIVTGMTEACHKVNVPLVGGETAEMPDTYLSSEHDLVGVITGVVEKDSIITGDSIIPGDVVVGLPSSGLHTNGYSLARKLFFDIGKFDVSSSIPDLDKSIGETLLEPHINYTNSVLALIDAGIKIHGIAHITGGGLVENIPRILPDGCAVETHKGSWPVLPIFKVMQSIDNVDDAEMVRTFNMGIGMVLIVEPEQIDAIKDVLQDLIEVFTIGSVVKGSKNVVFK